jgi:hypothetical protein
LALDFTQDSVTVVVVAFQEGLAPGASVGSVLAEAPAVAGMIFTNLFSFLQGNLSISVCVILGLKLGPDRAAGGVLFLIGEDPVLVQVIPHQEFASHDLSGGLQFFTGESAISIEIEAGHTLG